jgi:hypothetical protein
MQFKQDINDKRNSIRLDFKLPVEITCAESGACLRGVMVNLSVHGMLVQLPQADLSAVVGTKRLCLARIIFKGRGSNLMIDKLESTIVRIEGNRVGLAFIEPLEWFLLFNVYKGKQLRD